MKETERKTTGMTVIVKTVTRLTVGLVILFGVYVMFHGHEGIGGGFVGGVTIALAFILTLLAFGGDAALSRLPLAEGVRRGGKDALFIVPLAMLCFLGIWLFMTLSANAGWTGGRWNALLMIWCDVFIGINVGVGFFAVFATLVKIKLRKDIH
jgi:multicomponent Na+:H+ antiporter subunit B